MFISNAGRSSEKWAWPENRKEEGKGKKPSDVLVNELWGFYTRAKVY